MKRILIISAISLLTFTYCTKTVEGQYSDNNKVNFEEGQYVSFACGVPQTKASGTYSDNAISFAWQDGDELQVKVGEATGVLTYSASTEMFSGKMPAAGETFDLQWPNFEPTLSSQDYVVGGIDPKLIKATITGCSLSQTNISLTPANTVMCFKLSGTDKFKTIELLQNGTDNKYTLVMGTEATLTSSYSRYFIVVPKGETWSDGLTLSVKDKDGNEIWSQKTNKSISTNSPITMEKQTVVKKLMYKGHEYVDLGFYIGSDGKPVQSSDPTLTLKWATCNIGADTPEEVGDYFAFGEYQAYGEVPDGNGNNSTYNGMISNNTPKTNYDQQYWKWHKEKNSYAKYNTNLASLESADDAATHNWGGKWRTPTHLELGALVKKNNNNKETDTKVCNVSKSGNNYKFTSLTTGLTDKSISIPISSYYYQSAVSSSAASQMILMSSRTHQTTGTSVNIYYLYVKNTSIPSSDNALGSNRGYYGYPVRPVFSGLPD